jgi:hypothetical protein
VQVQVKNRLPRTPVGVEKRPVTPGVDASFTGNLLGHPVQVSDQAFILWGHLSQGGDMLAGHDQHMRRSLGTDILKSNDQFILVNDLGRPLPGDDVTEKTAQDLPL